MDEYELIGGPGDGMKVKTDGYPYLYLPYRKHMTSIFPRYEPHDDLKPFTTVEYHRRGNRYHFIRIN